MVRAENFEIPAFAMSSHCSASELRPQKFLYHSGC